MSQTKNQGRMLWKPFILCLGWCWLLYACPAAFGPPEPSKERVAGELASETKTTPEETLAHDTPDGLPLPEKRTEFIGPQKPDGASDEPSRPFEPSNPLEPQQPLELPQQEPPVDGVGDKREQGQELAQVEPDERDGGVGEPVPDGIQHVERVGETKDSPEPIPEPSPEVYIDRGPPPVFDDDICAGKRPCVTTYVGSPYDIKGPLSEVWFSNPLAVTFGPNGKMYVSDVGNTALIYQIDLQKSEFQVFVGSGKSGYKDGMALEAHLDYPCALAFDSKGALYFSERDKFVIRKVASGVVTTFAGSGKAGYKDGSPGQAMFTWPCGLAFDKNDNLYVGDYNYIRKITPSGQVSTFSGSGKEGYKDGTASQAEFSYPTRESEVLISNPTLAS